MTGAWALPSSFRDPSGFVFERDGVLYRQINASYKEHYDHLIGSGLYEKLLRHRLLIPHQEVPVDPEHKDQAYKILRPEPVPFISYPYEWSFGQLADAALAMLEVQRLSLEHGMSLKDASAYNIQFREGKPVLIDTLSFEKYRQGNLWPGYRQFCQHFLGPLALMSKIDLRMNQLMRVYIDGIPLDLASSLLPWYSYGSLQLLSHIHFHAKAQRNMGDSRTSFRRYRLSRFGLPALVDDLQSCVKSLRPKPREGAWEAYYAECNYSPDAQKHKEETVARLLRKVEPRPTMVWDLGANTGLYSRLASAVGCNTVAFDWDPACVQALYLETRRAKESRILPLVMDLTNPSPGLGWAGRERQSLAQRGSADVVLALALVHHLAIANNVPLDSIAEFMSSIGKTLIIEFVPKSDSQVKRLLTNRDDIFPNYSEQGFEAAFARYFMLIEAMDILNSQRKIYLMKKR